MQPLLWGRLQSVWCRSRRYEHRAPAMQARAGSQGVADAAPTHDEVRLAAAHAALADSVQAVLAAFSDSVQPAN